MPVEPGPGSFLPKTGNYRELLSYRKSEVIYDFTFRFCERFFSRGDRTVDQMVQAARSGKQNIAEGSKASLTSTETEVKLTNVARSSLEELLLDYQDFLRVRACHCGRKTPSKPYMSASWARTNPNPLKPTVHSSKTALLRLSPTSPSASSIRQTICSTSSHAVWKKTSWQKVGCANA
jgi:four helix bundle protein